MDWFKGIGVFVIMGLVVGILIWVLWLIPEEDSIGETDCFDRYSNKIVGQVCEEEIYGTPIWAKITITIVLLIVLIATTIGSLIER